MKTSLLIFLFTSIFFIALSQPYIDVVNVSYLQSRSTDLLSKEKNSFGFDWWNASLSLPFVLKDSSTFIMGVSFNELNFNKEAPLFINNEKDLNGSLTYQVQWKNKKWKTAFVFLTRYSHGFFDELNNIDGWQWGGAVLNTLSLKENIKIKFGIYGNLEYFGPYIIPLAGIDWRINQKWNVFGVLPGSMAIEYKATRFFHTGLSFRGITTSYLPMYQHYSLRVDDNYLKAFFDFYVAKKHMFSFEAGHSVLRKLRWSYRSGGETDYTNLNVSDGYFFRVVYAFRIRLDE